MSISSLDSVGCCNKQVWTASQWEIALMTTAQRWSLAAAAAARCVWCWVDSSVGGLHAWAAPTWRYPTDRLSRLLACHNKSGHHPVHPALYRHRPTDRPPLAVDYSPWLSRDLGNGALDSQYRSNLISISIRPKIQYSASAERSQTTVAVLSSRLVGDRWPCDPVSFGGDKLTWSRRRSVPSASVHTLAGCDVTRTYDQVRPTTGHRRQLSSVSRDSFETSATLMNCRYYRKLTSRYTALYLCKA